MPSQGLAPPWEYSEYNAACSWVSPTEPKLMPTRRALCGSVGRAWRASICGRVPTAGERWVTLIATPAVRGPGLPDLGLLGFIQNDKSTWYGPLLTMADSRRFERALRHLKCKSDKQHAARPEDLCARI